METEWIANGSYRMHLSTSGCRELLKSNAYGIAVGTPNRLSKLLESEGGEGEGRLSLKHTELKGVFPELARRDNIKIAMF
eukprot:15328792-Ditylum_brightwellii.AAC.1